jgi:hypothetical protein
MLRAKLVDINGRWRLLALVGALVGFMQPAALALDGGPYAHEPAQAQVPGGNHGGIYADWEYPDFAWTDEDADALAEWIPTPLNRDEAIGWIDWALAEELPDERTATTATYTLWDRGWKLTKAWPAPVHYIDEAGTWEPIETALKPTDHDTHTWHVSAHQTPMRFPEVLGQGAIEVSLFGFSEPLTLGASPRLVGGPGQAELSGGHVVVDAAQASWSSTGGVAHALEVTGFGLVQAAFRADGAALDVSRFEQHISVPPGLKASVDGPIVRFIDDTGMEQVRVFGHALTATGTANEALSWRVKADDDAFILVATVDSRQARDSLQSLSVQWQLGPDAVGQRLGGLRYDDHDGAVVSTCLSCAAPSKIAGVWAEFDWSALELGSGALRAWLETPGLDELADLSVAHADANPSHHERVDRDPIQDQGMLWSLPANWLELSEDIAGHARVASANQLDHGLATSVATATKGSLIFRGELSESMHANPFLPARLAQSSVTVQTLGAQLFPLYVDSFPGTCHGYACWQEYGWSIHGTHAESPMVSRVETGFAISMPTTESCSEGTEPVNTWLASPWVTVTESSDIQAIRWIDDLALEGDWDTVSAELRLEYRFRDTNWEISGWKEIADGATHGGDPAFAERSEGARDAISFEPGALPSSVRDVQLRYRVEGTACIGGLGADPLAAAKAAAAKANKAGWWGCNGSCNGSGLNCGSCVCYYGSCYIYGGGTTSCWPCGGGATNTGQCNVGYRYCKGGNWSGCNNAVCPSTEVCDGVDNNCNGSADEPGASGCTWFYYDADGDGYGSNSASCRCWPSGGYTAWQAGDCNNYNASVHPGAPETCNGVDDNCDGLYDVGIGLPGCKTFYKDGDGDGYGSSDSRCLCFPMVPWNVTNASDCNDGNSGIHPGQGENCGTWYDDNCNGATNEQNASGCNTYYWDADGDGYGTSSSACYCSSTGNWRSGTSGDCNDGNSGVNPGANEVCNGVNDNCKNGTDEGLGSTTCGQGQCYHTQANCVGGSSQSCDSYQGATAESCDGADNDCDGSVDENWSLGTACDGSDADQCAEGIYVCNGSGGATCNDYSGNSVEVCDGVDNDCDGVVDEANANGCTVYYIDGDNDGYGIGGSSVCTCGPSGSYKATNTSDCADNDGNIHPGHAEWCDNKDNDCDGGTDEGYGLGATCDSSDSDSCSDGIVICNGNLSTKCDGELLFALDFNDGKSDATGNGRWYGMRRGAHHVSNGHTWGGVEFDGKNDYIYVNHGDDLLPSEGITIGMWVNPDAGMNCSGSNNWRYLAAKSGYGEYHLIFEQNYSVGWTVRVNGSDQRLWSGGNSLPANQWSHYVATYNFRTGEQRAFVNGALTASRTGPAGSLPNYGGQLRFGNWSTQSACRSGSGAYNGRVDDILFYRRALSDSEISTIYGKEGRPTNEPVFGFNKELCDGIDNDCDGATDEGHNSGASCDSSADADLCQDNRTSCDETGYDVTCREGPVARWLDGAHDGNTVLDTSGNGVNGTAHNVSFQSEGAYFNGSNAYVDVPGNTLLDVPNYSVVLWLKPQSTSTYWTGVFGQHGGGRSMNFWMGASDGGGPYQVHHTGGVPGNWNFACNAWGLQQNAWNHVVLTHDADGARRTYINGNQVCHATSPGENTSTGSHPIVMGRNLDGGNSNYFKGWLKDVTLYRYAITPTEVAESYVTDSDESANLELCDKIDNDCDGTTDEGYSLYGACEGDDVDTCEDGTIICGASGTSTTCRDASPVGFWDFNEGAGNTVADVADNQNPHPGVFQSDPAFVTGKIGTGLAFDGNDAVNVGNHPELKLTGREMTMEAWIRSTASGIYGIIVNKDYSYEIGVRSGGRFQCAIKTTDKTWKWRGYTYVNDNQWHHVACVLDTDGMIRTYVDGNLDHAEGPFIFTDTGHISDSNEQLRIGRRKTGMYFRKGIIDEVAVYDVALTHAEIQARAAGSEQLVTKNYERCDDRDNNCNNATDEPFADKGDLCQLGGCSTGEMVCNATMTGTYCQETSGGGSAIPELCNGTDDDCDGSVDEDFTYSYQGLVRRVGQACDGFGDCGVGTVECTSEAAAACSTNPNGTASQAQAEVCDYQDNDCDQTADDGISYQGAGVGGACDGVGACGAGVVECNLSSVTPTCSTNPDGSDSNAAAEICDGQDNDCDGATDEGYMYADPVAGVNRVIGQLCYGYGTCGAGVVVCAGPSGATCSSNPGMVNDNSKPETCNALDDDCDGSTDEAPTGGALTQGCYTGPAGTKNVGVCVGGVRTCSAGNYGGCIGETTPGANDMSCDGKDQDCDGSVDENYVTTSCGVGECSATSSCIGGLEKPCSPGTPTADNQCDGRDNDCDGSNDEHYVTQSCGKGVCAAISSCSDGTETTCSAGSPTMATEINNCDTLDNDCDGLTDESYDDGVGCTDSSCVNGVASNTPNHGACQDGQSCTDDSCHAQFDCVNVADNTNAPDPSQIDANPCTTLQCYGGTSQNLADDTLIPDDGLWGTVDTCSGGVESHTISDNACVIGGVSYNKGDVDTANSCRVCYPAESQTSFSGTILRENFDTADASDWEMVDASGSGVAWHRSKARAYSPEWALYMGDPTFGSYGVGAHVQTWATSPEFWLPSGIVSMLSFRVWLETEAFNQAVSFDVLFLDVVRADGSTVPVWNSVDSLNGTTAGNFRQVTVDLGDFTDQTIRLRWRFDSGDELFNDFEGAYIDDIAVTTACCSSASDCDDSDDCTIDSCQSGRCDYIHTCELCSPTPVNMMVLLDHSGSMNEQAHAGTSLSRWQAATNSLVQVLSTYGPVLNTSLKLFKTPGPAPCHVSPDGLELPFHSSSQDVANFLTPLVPGGLSPMANGLYGAEAAYATSGLSGTKYVLLITDGTETCGGDPIKAIEDLYAAGLDVYVIGFGEPGDDGIDHDVLNDMAEAGGHGRNIETADEAAYYHASSSQQLTEVMIDIFGEAAAESCNGTDDDCDGVTDEGVTPIVCNVDCGVWGKAGERTCSGGSYTECTINPETEICNAEDDDCNGTVDDQWTDDDGPALGEACSLGVGECRRDGVFVCPLNQITEPVCNAVPALPSAEVCDNLDNDCDGLTDDGLKRDCSTACGPGDEVCIAGNWVNCDAPPVLPDNQCDYVDNDCDGTTDPLYPEVHDDCDGTDSDYCAYGTWTCRPAENGTECINENPENVVEVCDGVEDEDCDGLTDEENAVGCTDRWYDADDDLYGAAGPRCLCTPVDKWTATQGGDCNDANANAFPGNPEVCDNVDNDCNAITDEDPDAIDSPLNRPCYEGPNGTLNVGICREGTEKCYTGAWSACLDQVMPQTEICNGLDDDCDAFADPDEPNFLAGEKGADHPCFADPNCTLGTCYCMENDQTNDWSCILE